MSTTPVANDFMSKPGRWNGPVTNDSVLPRRGSKEWLDARLARSNFAQANAQPSPSAPEPARTEAGQIAYVCGIAGVEPLAQRVIDLEGVVAELIETIQRLESKRR